MSTIKNNVKIVSSCGQRLIALKKTNSRLKVIVSIGGGMAEGFSDAALTDASRALFADSAVELLRRFSADGIDIDWEYPGQGVAGIKYRAEDRQNFTRFFLLRTPQYARRHPVRGDAKTQWKTSLVFSTRNSPGALFRALSAFALRDLNLTKIESRPLRGKPWEYLFYVDFLERADAPAAVNALNHLREIADFLRVLGCYPKGA